MTKLLVALVFLSFSTEAAEKKSPEQYWSETGLSRNELHRFVNTKVCYNDANYFLGCINAINTLGAQITTPVRLVPSTFANDSSLPFGSVTKNFDKLSFVTLRKVEKKSGESFRASWLRDSANRDRSNATVKAIFNATKQSKNGPVSIESILAYIEAQAFADSSKEASIVAAAITAFLQDSVDAHAHLNATASVEANINDAGENFTGIGATLQNIDGKTVVQSPVEGGPAMAAGIRANDVILNVDDLNTMGVDLGEVVKKIRGPENSTVVLRIERSGKEITVPILRKKIVLENITMKFLERAGSKTALIKLRSFMDRNACNIIAGKLRNEIAKSGASGLILDLRSNGGGLLDQANCLGGLFVGREVILKVKDLQSDSFDDYVSDKEMVTNLPLVVLINAGSASASEILAGALQDYRRAWILGERSFGKATVQTPMDFLGNTKIMMYRTTQRFYQPLGRTNQIVGILPNFVVPVKPNATEDERFSLREGDIYPNALEALSTPWQDPRAVETLAVQDCMNRQGNAKQRFEHAQNDVVAPDYQVFAAEDVLRCAR